MNLIVCEIVDIMVFYELVFKMCVSFWVIGFLVVCMYEVWVFLFGGCVIGI